MALPCQWPCTGCSLNAIHGYSTSKEKAALYIAHCHAMPTAIFWLFLDRAMEWQLPLHVALCQYGHLLAILQLHACRWPCCACSLHKAMHSAMGVTCLRIVSALQWPLHPKPFLLFIAIPSRSHGRVCQSRLPSALQHRACSLLLMVPTQP